MFKILYGDNIIDDVERRLRFQTAEDNALSLRDAVAQVAVDAVYFHDWQSPDRQTPGVLAFCRCGVPGATNAPMPEAAEERIIANTPPAPEWRSPWRRVEGAPSHMPANGAVGGLIATLLAQAAVVDLSCRTWREAAAVVAVMRIGLATGAWRVACGGPPEPWRIGECEMASLAWLLNRLPGRVRASAPLLADAAMLAHHRADMMEAAAVAADDVQAVRAFGALLEAMAFAGFEAFARHDDDEIDPCLLDDFDDDDISAAPGDFEKTVDQDANIGKMSVDAHEMEHPPARAAGQEPEALIDEDGRPSWRRDDCEGSPNREAAPEMLIRTLSAPPVAVAFAALFPMLLARVTPGSKD